MDFLINVFLNALLQVWTSFTHNWPFLLVSILIAVAMKLYIDASKVSAFLIRYRRAGVIGAVIAAVTTPLCSCGTTAIILAMMAGTMPWAPIVAFMVSSPLTSPEGLVYSAGLFGWPFAIAFYVASILLGLLGGAAAGFAESRGWLVNQNRLVITGRPAGSGDAAHSLPEPSPRIPVPAVQLISNPRPERVTPVLSLVGLVPAPACACSSDLPLQAAPVPPAAASSSCSCSAPAAIPTPTTCGCGDPTPIPAASSCGCGSSASLTASPIPDTGSTCGCGNAAPVPEDNETGCGCAAAPSVSAPAEKVCGCDSSTPAPVASTCGCGAAAGSSADAPVKPPVTLRLFLSETLDAGRRLLVMFFGFAFIGYFLNGLIPQSWVTAVFGSGNIYSVPLAATLGLPLYINSEASLPLVRALIDGGMSQGAALAFLITGAGTSIGALAGALTIARWRVIGLVIGTLWLGSIAIGFLFNLLLAAGLF